MDSDRSRELPSTETANPLSIAPGPPQQDWSARMDAIARRRDRNSFLCIYDHFSPRVRGYLRGLGGSTVLAEELTQEALLRLWQHAGQYDPARGNLGSWLFRIARNLYIDRGRSEPVWSRTQEYLDGLDSPAAWQQNPVTESYTEEAIIRHAVAQLPPIHARVIRMSYFEAKSHQTIAAELDIPLGTVKSHLRRAFLSLQNDLRCER